MYRTAYPNIAKKTTRLYLLALTAVALLSVGGQLLVQQSLTNQLSDSRVINIAGRQRMLSQKICKTVVLLQNQHNHLATSAYLSDLDKALDLWQLSHNGLKSGYLTYLKLPVDNSDTINKMFAEVDHLFQTIYANARYISKYYHTISSLTPGTVAINTDNIFANEGAFLKGMDRIVFQYDAEASRRVNKSQQIEHILLFCTLGILLLEGLFIFRPAVNQIRHTIRMLINSEKNTQKINKELVLVNKSLEETREALLEATNQKYQQEINDQKIRSAYLIEGQEEERKRLAQEIHDGLGQMLTALKYGIEKISNAVNDTESSQQHLTTLRGLVSQTIAEVRTISFNLMPAVLSDFGISSALKLLASQVTGSTGVQVLYTTNWNGKRLPKNIEIGLYRVSQEAINNAVKYAQATEISVELWLKKKFIHLCIADNGQGFKYEKLISLSEKTSSAHGISNMKERVYIMNGEIDIIAKPGKGTKIHVKLPFLPLYHEQD